MHQRHLRKPQGTNPANSIKLCVTESAEVNLGSGAGNQERMFYDFWTRKPALAPQRNRTRATLFRIVHETILDSKMFGLDGFTPSVHLESGLSSFEAAIKKAVRGKCAIYAKEGTSDLL